MFTKYESGAEVDIEVVKRFENGAEVEADAVYKFVNGAEEEVWANKVIVTDFSYNVYCGRRNQSTDNNYIKGTGEELELHGYKSQGLEDYGIPIAYNLYFQINGDFGVGATVEFDYDIIYSQNVGFTPTMRTMYNSSTLTAKGLTENSQKVSNGVYSYSGSVSIVEAAAKSVTGVRFQLAFYDDGSAYSEDYYANLKITNIKINGKSYGYQGELVVT